MFLPLLAPSGFRKGENTFFTEGSFPFPSAAVAATAGPLPFKEAETTRRAGEGLFTEAIVADGLREMGSELLAALIGLEGTSETVLVLG